MDLNRRSPGRIAASCSRPRSWTTDALDVYERAIPDGLVQNAIAIATLVYHAANREQRLPKQPLQRPRRVTVRRRVGPDGVGLRRPVVRGAWVTPRATPRRSGPTRRGPRRRALTRDGGPLDTVKFQHRCQNFKVSGSVPGRGSVRARPAGGDKAYGSPVRTKPAQRRGASGSATPSTRIRPARSARSTASCAPRSAALFDTPRARRR